MRKSTSTLMGLAAVALAVVAMVSADLRRTAGRDGCAAISRSDLRTACAKARHALHAACGTHGPVACTPSAGRTLRRELALAVEALDAAERRARALSLRAGLGWTEQGTLAAAMQEAVRGRAAVAGLKRRLHVHEAGTRIALDGLGRCLDAHAAVAEALASAQARAASASPGARVGLVRAMEANRAAAARVEEAVRSCRRR